ncbi:TROVE domain-containing protein [Diaphorobacter sp. HDW4A]|uniref:vWA domain-containing protein n=1 Tax=Diaphorobacter sp. HDW4A TaxID=2714924 RepID=UPI00140DC4D6|nr:TROVE domain-containing protein [Diaphorobacter sp. HDW4A]QIL82506.1 TROVE domain-containing protein [Diaphorobacter sp. HDW4A]
MVNTQLFKTSQGAMLQATNAQNNEGAAAYAYTPRHQLAQLAVTGCLGQTFYASAEEQLDQIGNLVVSVDNTFTAKTAVYARERGYMKDMPATLTAALAVWNTELFAQVFPRVIDNGKMLRNFVQIVRSGAMGRKSLGSRPKKLVQNWLLNATEKQLLNASVGNTPSLADVVKMVHPKPTEAWRAAWFAWLIGKPFNEADLPPITQAFERFKRDNANGVISTEVPEVPFQMLTALTLYNKQWAEIAKNGSWQMVRQNLNTFARHGVFEVPGMTQLIAQKLADANAVAKARAMPYQLMAAFNACDEKVPAAVRSALQDAMEHAIANVPTFGGNVVVCADVSGSMSSPVTGYRAGATTAVRCIDVAGLMAAAVLRKNGEARVLPFENKVVKLQLNGRDSVMTNAQKLAKIGGGGTNCSAPLEQLANEKAAVDLVIMVSDNESWVDGVQRGATNTMLQWERVKQRNPQAKLVCIDIQPYGTTQAMERKDILNVGGFSDAVFDVVASFADGKLNADHWVGEIEKIVLAPQ